MTWQPTEAEYFATRDWLSHSEFKLFMRSPRLYERHVIQGVPVKTNESMEFGKAVDEAVLHPDGFCAGVAWATPEVLSKTGRKVGKKWAAFLLASQGKTVLKDGEPVARVIQSICEHTEAHAILDSLGDRQKAIRWVCEVEGVTIQRRAKIDLLPTGLPFIVDLKTARDVEPSTFAKAIIDLGYHTQAVWYQDAVEAEYGRRPPFLIVAAQNCEPYGVEVYELNETFEMLGRKAIDEGLRRFVNCRRNETWRPESHGTIVKLAPPRWAEAALQDWQLPVATEQAV